MVNRKVSFEGEFDNEGRESEASVLYRRENKDKTKQIYLFYLFLADKGVIS
jgi:hypothetical protein